MVMYMPPATTLKAQVTQKLMFEPAIDSSHVHISCEDGVVFLSGSVNSLFEKNTAERAIKSIAGIKEVINSLHVNLADKYKKEDAELKRAIINTLKWDVAVPENEIRVDVKDGDVTLTGKVEWWYQKNSAEKAIRNLSGIKSISNQISLHPIPSSKNIKKKISHEFHRNAAIDANKIHIEVIGNKVILSGSVASWPELKEAVRAVWSTSGVNEVDNQLTINSTFNANNYSNELESSH